jgi:hypothetical protein
MRLPYPLAGLLALLLSGCGFDGPKIEGARISVTRTAVYPEFFTSITRGLRRSYAPEDGPDWLRIDIVSSYDFSRIDVRRFIPMGSRFWFCGAFDERYLSGGGARGGLFVIDDDNHPDELRWGIVHSRDGTWKGGALHPFMLFPIWSLAGEDQAKSEPPSPPLRSARPAW